MFRPKSGDYVRIVKPGHPWNGIVGWITELRLQSAVVTIPVIVGENGKYRREYNDNVFLFVELEDGLIPHSDEE